MREEGCRRTVHELWTAWPRVEEAPAEALEHARSCPSCGKELEALKAACVAAPEPWSALAPMRWRRLAARTKQALKGQALPSRRVWVWAPAAALAAVVSIVLLNRAPVEPPPLPRPAPAVPANVPPVSTSARPMVAQAPKRTKPTVVPAPAPAVVEAPPQAPVPAPAVVAEPPAEVLDNIDLLRNMELLEDWDASQGEPS